VPVRIDFVQYHKSIDDEFKATQNRVRNLIADCHWLTDGEYKEVILRKVLRSCLPEFLHIGRGFVCYEQHSSTQLDVLITNKDRPTLFQEGNLVIVTPDCVEAIVEVKTKLERRSELTETLTKLANQVEDVRWKKPGRQCWAGLFVFDGPEGVDAGDKEKSRNLLEAIAEASQGEPEGAINCVALGSELFVRYWPDTMPGAGTPGWQSYVFNEGTHARLAPAYFVSNLVWQISPDTSAEMKYAWFPIPKQGYRIAYVALGRSGVSFYERTHAT
jgi:hypothetical protein